MIESLKIKNFAVIEEAEIQFHKGLNIISGETGAGKSIVIEAISLLLGHRASSEVIRTGATEAVVEGLFDISKMEWVKKKLQDLDLANGEDELLIRRMIQSSGKNKIYINGHIATLQILVMIAEDLVDLCSQNEHQSLTKSSTQISILDQYGGLVKKAFEVTSQFAMLKQLNAESKLIRSSEEERKRRLDFLTFEIEEIEKAQLQAGDEDRLQQEKKLFQSAEQRLQTLSVSRALINDGSEGRGILEEVKVLQSKLRSVVSLDEALMLPFSISERVVIDLEELDSQLEKYLISIDVTQEKIEEVQTKMSLIAGLKRKYGISVEEILKTLEALKIDRDKLGGADERLVEIEEKSKELALSLGKLGETLSKARKNVAKLLSDSVSKELKDLNMKESLIRIEVLDLGEIDSWSTSGGPNEVHFLIQTNKGEEAKPLGKIASGGELSRLMLSIRRVVSEQGHIGVYLFDEIDAGIGGQTAFQVGKKLKSVAKGNQVICITHLPQVAVFADHHLIVSKKSSAKRTITEVVSLAEYDRKQEIARMLGGDQVTKGSLKNAEELLSLAH